MKYAILSYQGFTETRREKTGSEKLYVDVVRNYASPEIHTRFPEDWTADVKAIINQLYRNGLERLFITCYSHGQAAAMACAKYAISLGIKVDCILICDGVARTPIPRKNIFQVFAWRSLLKTGSIVIPPGVGSCLYVRQENNIPMGHKVVSKDGNTPVRCVNVIDCKHTEIDDSAEWFNLVDYQLAKWTKTLQQ
jgi:hypothetical protein